MEVRRDITQYWDECKIRPKSNTKFLILIFFWLLKSNQLTLQIYHMDYVRRNFYLVRYHMYHKYMKISLWLIETGWECYDNGSHSIWEKCRENIVGRGLRKSPLHHRITFSNQHIKPMSTGRGSNTTWVLI